MAQKSPLDDSATSALAWARWRSLMKVVALATALTVAAALLFFAAQDEPVSVHFYVAVALGISITMMLGGALMGLAFLSSGTGHDEAVGDD